MKTYRKWCESVGKNVGDYQDHELIYKAGLIEGLECGASELARMVEARDKANSLLEDTNADWIITQDKLHRAVELLKESVDLLEFSEDSVDKQQAVKNAKFIAEIGKVE